MPALAVPPIYVEVRAWDLDFESAGYGHEGQQVTEGLKEIATAMSIISEHAAASLHPVPQVSHEKEVELRRPQPKAVYNLSARISEVTRRKPRIIGDDD